MIKYKVPLNSETFERQSNRRQCQLQAANIFNTGEMSTYNPKKNIFLLLLLPPKKKIAHPI